ncbi:MULTISPECIES: FRG domain-containing protein [unclassified Ensifer]|uniref:FRG domain-containing protein n=1 Tax=unclassified Ensifer TaxID=2633371 RepID=UPI00300FFAA0
MPGIIEHTPGSFGDLLDQVETFQESRNFAWYRGSGNVSHSLVPTLARRTPNVSADELNRIEKGIANSFAQRSPPFVDANFTNEWRSLFYMQHYGIPTRLLDWSESPFVGLYFALTSVRRDAKGKPASDVALWMCDPVAWNRTALNHISFAGDILDEYCEEIKAYSPSSDIDQRATIPIMIYGTHNSPRIVAQRGVFSLFGKGVEGMEKVFTNGAFPDGSLQKLVIQKTNIDPFLKSLHRKGFAESTIYPDLFGLSLEIKRSFGYY